MAYENQNGIEIKEIKINVNDLIDLFNKASEDALKSNADILNILSHLERDILDSGSEIESQPEREG